MSGRFEGKGVVVTGAAQGIGRATAQAFAAEGAGVVVLDVEGDVLAETAAEIKKSGGTVHGVVGDVSKREDVKAAVDLAVKSFGRVDAAVQVAGIADFVPFLEFTDRSWDRILDVNLRGAWYLAQEAARVMVRDGVKGAIVLTASTNAFQPEAGGLAYNTSKAGIVAVMQTAALELSRVGIRVNAIAPGPIRTDMLAESFDVMGRKRADAFVRSVPLRRTGEPAEIAAVVNFLVSDAASYITAQVIYVNGGGPGG